MKETCVMCEEEMCESLGEVVMTRPAMRGPHGDPGDPPEYDWMCYDCMVQEEEEEEWDFMVEVERREMEEDWDG